MGQLTLAIGVVFGVAALFQGLDAQSTPQRNVTVHVVEANTGKPLSDVAVNLRLGDSPGRRTLQTKTDSNGIAYFYITQPLPHTVSVDAFSIHYHEIEHDPIITSLPQEVTIPVRRLSVLESLHFLFVGD
jgi:hypothetical protein